MNVQFKKDYQYGSKLFKKGAIVPLFRGLANTLIKEGVAKEYTKATAEEIAIKKAKEEDK